MSNDISDLVKKSKVLLLDIEGTTTSITFVKDKLFPYAEENVKPFLDAQWDSEDVKAAVEALRKLAIEDKENKVDGVVDIPSEEASKEDQIEGVVKSVKWQMSSDRKVGPLKQLQGLIWKQGYDNGDIKGHVYDDVLPALEQWRSNEDKKVFIYSSGSVQAQKLLFGQSSSGDMLKVIDGHFDTNVGMKQESQSYEKIVQNIGCKADEVLFLTDILKEAEAAKSAGVSSALVSREGNSPLPDDVTNTFPVIQTFAQLQLNYKRKIDQQDEQPSKIAKTENEVTPDPAAENKETAEPEKMETTPEPEKVEVTAEPEKMETAIEETDESPTAVTNPIVTEEQETEMVTEKTESEIPETPIEVSEVTDEERLEEVAEIIEDLKPVIEEPQNDVDIADLANVGDVLEKECDAILMKVQDVTNLDNIAVKPILNTIEEVDSDEIVERILDTEIITKDKTDDAGEIKETGKEAEEINKPEENNAESENIAKEQGNNEKPQESNDIAQENNDKAQENNDKAQENNDQAQVHNDKIKELKDNSQETNDTPQENNEKVQENNDKLPENGDKPEEISNKPMNGVEESMNGETNGMNGKNGDLNGSNGKTNEMNGADEVVAEIKVKTVDAESVAPAEVATEG